jgi:hypothetical protein
VTHIYLKRAKTARPASVPLKLVKDAIHALVSSGAIEKSKGGNQGRLLELT